MFYVLYSSEKSSLALMTAVYTPDILSVRLMRSSAGTVSNCREGVPTGAEHVLAALPSLCGPTHPKPSQLGLGRVTMEVRSSGTALITFLLGQISITQPGGVF